jgi:serine/threonine protein kinase
VSRRVEELFGAWVERHVLDGTRLDPAQLCGGDTGTADELRRCIAEYDALQETLGNGGHTDEQRPLPEFSGFRTIERIGSGGVGDVYKLEDLELGRTVAAKVLREGSALHRGVEGFLQEARSLALFEDPRIVRVLEFRRDSTPPALLMEYVDGFPLDRIARSLEYPQRAKLMIEIAGAIDHAHGLGVQHRDLKPANILVDAGLRPRILDFGLAGSDQGRGHGLGTPAYMAPEQLDPSLPIDARTDVYALGVVLYEVLCGKQPYQAATRTDWIETIRRGEPTLPVELQPDVPEPLQAIALKAMETDPELRYASAREFAADLQRWLDGRPVTARPTVYRDTLSRRVQPHIEQIREWSRLKLLWPHEARALEKQYRRLEVREEEWILSSRNLSLSQIALYLGAVLMFCGGIAYYVAYLNEAVTGIWGPLVFLGGSFAAINLVARRLYLSGREAVGVAFHLAAVLLLPLFALAALEEIGWWPATGGELELATDWVSNRRLQVVTGLTALWGCTLAAMTRTVTFSAYSMIWSVTFYLALLGDYGLTTWLSDGDMDAFGLRLLPLAAALGLAAIATDRTDRGWFSRPTWVSAALVFAFAVEFVALDGQAMARLGLTLAPLVSGSEGDPVALDTAFAMALNGLLFYGLGRLAESVRVNSLSTTSWLLVNAAPFAILQPVAALASSGDYPLRFTWLYLALAFGVTLLSYARQRKAFYYAGLLNTVLALYFLTRDYGWWDRADWALVLLGVAAVLLVAGWALHRREQPGVTRRR